MHECMRLLSVGVSVAEEKDHGVRLAARASLAHRRISSGLAAVSRLHGGARCIALPRAAAFLLQYRDWRRRWRYACHANEPTARRLPYLVPTYLGLLASPLSGHQ